MARRQSDVETLEDFNLDVETLEDFNLDVDAEERFSDASIGGIHTPNDSGSDDDENDADAEMEEEVCSDGDQDEWVHEWQQPQLNFTATPMANIGPAESPYDFFNLFFNIQFMQILVESINSQATQALRECNSQNARINRWKRTNVAELKTFLGLLFHMGHIKLNRINDYWRRDSLFHLPFSLFMSRDRFLLILKNLCFFTGADNVQNSCVRYTKPIIDFFNDLMATLVVPVKNLTIDEGLVLWRDRLAIRRHIKGKRQKYGIKLYVLTDFKGTCQKIAISYGTADSKLGGKDHTNKVVKLLMENYLDQGYCLFMDKFYNSIGLAEELLARKTYCTGTLRTRRSRNPSHVSARVPPGTCLYRFNKNGVCVANFNDRKKVLALSTQYSGRLTETTDNRGNSVLRPQMIIEYSKNMRELDFKDQLLSYYSCYPKSMRWYKKIIVHVFQVMMLNSFLLYKVQTPEISLYDYRLQIVRSLLNSTDVTDARDATDRQRTRLRTNTGELVHTPSECPRDERRKTKRRRCALCWRKENRRKLTKFYCRECPQQPGLCVSCFGEFHNY